MEILSEQQLRWRCRRGVRELDVLFDRFLNERYAGLSTNQKQKFAQFLTEQDPIIMDWLFARTQPSDPDYQTFTSMLQALSGL